MVHFEPDPIYYPNEDINLTDWVPALNDKIHVLNTNSWFDMNYIKNYENIQINEYRKQVPIISDESIKQQLRSFKRRKIVKDPEFLCAKKIRLTPTLEQKRILQLWFDAFDKMYNKTVDYLRSVIFYNKKLQLDVAFDEINFMYLRNGLKECKNEIIQSMDKKDRIKVHIMDEAIKLATANYKGCLTKFVKGDIKKFRVRELSKGRRRRILLIEASFFKNSTFCKDTFPEMKSSESLDNIDKTCTLQYDNDSKKYILLVPKVIPMSMRTLTKRSCGVDQGCRTFAEIYCETGVYSIGNEIESDIKTQQRKNKKITKLLNPINQDLTKKKKRSHLIKGLRKYNKRITDKINELHFKTAHLLIQRFDTIYLGKISTSNIVSKKKNSNISPRTREMMNLLSFYKFRVIMQYMGNKYGVKVVLVNEYLTTRTCSNCGKNNKDIGSKEYHKCSCGMLTGRDANAAKNIYKVGINQ